jgi:tetratricopeptide (TPR) repeat protein
MASLSLFHTRVQQAKMDPRESEESDVGKVGGSWARSAIFTVGVLLIPVVVFVLAEVGLRIGGYGDDLALFEVIPGYPDYLRPNPDVGRRYFMQTRTVPSPSGGAFRAKKSETSFRIFVQGGSTAAGFPYGHGASFPRILGGRLARALPEQEVEVVNTAMDAVSTHTLRDFVDEIVEQKPDAVLVYAGHNEFYGALGVGSTESLGDARWLIHAYLSLDHFRVVQLLRSFWASILTDDPSGDTVSPGATLMQEMARDREIPLGSPRYHRGVEQFRDNMTAALCRYRDEGIPVFVGTLASNERDQPPFVSVLDATTDREAWEQTLAEVQHNIDRNDLAAARTSLDRLLEIDPGSADVHYLLGRLLREAGRYQQAREAFRRARDLDVLRFRAPEELNTVLRQVAEMCGATVVDTQSRLAAAAQDGIIGSEVMLEHLHPNVDGYFLMADEFFVSLASAFPNPQQSADLSLESERREVYVTSLDSALASLHVRRLKNNWPFQPLGVTKPDTFRVSSFVDELALSVVRRERSWLDATAQLGADYESRGQLQEALRIALTLASEEPYRSVPVVLGARILMKMGRTEDALRMFSLADEREPNLDARHEMGRLLIRLGRAEEAIAPLRAALSLSTRNEAVRYDLAAALAMSGRLAEARAVAETLLRDNPGHAAAARLLERLETAR